MSRLFDNYKKGYQYIPDNEKVYLKTVPEYKDVINLGASNTHNFLLPFSYEDLKAIEISYIQGTEIKLKKSWNSDLLGGWFFESEPITDDIRLFEDYVGSQLYEIAVKDTNLDYYKSLDDFDLEKIRNLPFFCVLYYNLSLDDIKLFNNYNTDLYVQLTLTVKLDDETEICLSDKYRLKPVENINLIGKDITDKE